MPASNKTAPATARSRIRSPQVTLSEADGVRFLHFGTEWVQGAMRLARPFALELEYQQHMMALGLLVQQPQRILVLGLGAAALAKFCWRSCAPAQVVVVELTPAVVEVARQWFHLPPDDERLSVVIDDAAAYIRQPAQRRASDWLLVDLYDSAARGPVYDDVDFYRTCRAALREPGVAAFNLFGSRFKPSLAAIAQAFNDCVVALPPTEAGNRIVLAYRGNEAKEGSQANDFESAWQAAPEQASALQARWRLPLQKWVRGMTKGMPK